MKRLYKLFKIYYLDGEKRNIYYKIRSYKQKVNYMLNYLFNFNLIGCSKLYQGVNIKLLSILRRWEYFLYPYRIEFRRNRFLGKYFYNTIPNQISRDWLEYSGKSVWHEEYWFNKAVYERSYVNTMWEFIDLFSLFERVYMPLMFEDFLFFFILFMFHRYIDRYFSIFICNVCDSDKINYLPDIYTNEDYLDPPIIDPDFVCKYIKVAIMKEDTLYEAISEVRVWISRSLHKYKAFSYLYRKYNRIRIQNSKMIYKTSLVRSVKIEISGRVSDRKRTIVRVYKTGWKVTTSRVNHRPLLYSSTQGQSKYGVFGIKVWVFFHHILTSGYIR